MSLEIVFILSNSANPDEMQPFAAFHPGLHCLKMYIFTYLHVQVSRMKRDNSKYRLESLTVVIVWLCLKIRLVSYDIHAQIHKVLSKGVQL